MKGVCDLGAKNPDLDEIEATFLKALEVTRSKNNRFWELRCAISLAKLWEERKERQKTYDLLFPIYDWFTEGFDTANLKEGKTLLDELQ